MIDMNIIRAYDGSVDSVDKADRSLVARINTASVDRYRTVIDPRGGKLENYRKNPIVLWEHSKDPRRFTDPIGRNLWVKHNGGQRPTELIARTRFLEDDFSQQRFEWYRDGTLNAFSVNILPVAERCSPPTAEELRALPEWGSAETIYREWDLAEYSGTSCPGNAECLVADRAYRLRDLVLRDLINLPDDVMILIDDRIRTATESAGGMAAGGAAVGPGEAQKRYITHSGKKWIVHAEDGKVLGEHDSEEDAKAQLAAIEAHKHDEGRALPVLEGRRLHEIAIELASERRALQQSLRDEVIAMIDLLVYGRV
jgi:hypothetical protein